MSATDLARLRAEYGDRPIVAEGDESQLDPLELFERWLADAVAAELAEPNAMALATATRNGRPAVRTVLLKGVDNDGLVFYTNYESRKGQELAANPIAAASMLWHPMHRQVRIEGAVTRVSAAESDAYFATRPPGSQISAAASPQSQTIAGRSELHDRWAELERRYANSSIPRPTSWGGYRLAIEEIEFWQGRRNRLHERLRFARNASGWTRSWLAP